jgi:hypothetical protein
MTQPQMGREALLAAAAGRERGGRSRGGPPRRSSRAVPPGGLSTARIATTATNVIAGVATARRCQARL